MNRRKALYTLNLAIALALAFLVVWTSKPWQVWKFSGAFITTSLAALLIDAALVWVWAQRHAFVLSAVGSNVSPRSLLPLVTFSNTANNLTPAASGEVMRAWFLKRNYGVPIDRAGGAIIFERFFLFGLMAATALGAGLAESEVSRWLVALGVGGIVVYVFAVPRVVELLARRVGTRPQPSGRIRQTLRSAATSGIELWGDSRVALVTSFWSLAAFACQGAVFWLAASRSGLSLTPLETWALVGGGTAIGVLSFLPFGLGAAEITAAGIAAILGLPVTTVASAFVLYRIFFTFPLALAGSYAYGKLSGLNALEADPV